MDAQKSSTSGTSMQVASVLSVCSCIHVPAVAAFECAKLMNASDSVPHLQDRQPISTNPPLLPAGTHAAASAQLPATAWLSSARVRR
jgi:hypothetical protein